ncbi:MAG TPA: hypothetical protein PKE31_10190 [Pseudomonadota bacterium]|jgi:hypothetical protein|nr:hypothetical protein [Pseudomonadota bacterium]
MNENTKVYDQKGLRVLIMLESQSATVTWEGHCSPEGSELQLSTFLKNHLAFLKGRSLTVEFRPLEFMSSAFQGPILQFLKSLASNGIKTRVIYSSAMEWQRISYRCMKVLFRAMPQIQFECM